MAERFLDLLLRGMRPSTGSGLHKAVLEACKRRATPPTPAEQQDIYTDQW